MPDAPFLGDQPHGQGGHRDQQGDPERRAARDVVVQRVAERRRSARCGRLRLSTSSQKLSQAMHLERQQDQERHRAEEVGRQLAAQQGGNVSHRQTASSSGSSVRPGPRSGDGLDEPVFQGRPPQVELAERPAVLDDPLGQRLAEVGAVLVPGPRTRRGRPRRRSRSTRAHPGSRLQRPPDRLGRAPGFEHDRVARSAAGRAGRPRRSVPVR